MLAVAHSVYRLFMVGRDKVPNVGSYKLLGPKLDKDKKEIKSIQKCQTER